MKPFKFYFFTILFKLDPKGTFERMQKQIRKRDQRYSGCVNPMVHNFGHSSEALQYSGRVNQSTEHFSFIKRNKTTQPWTIITPCSGNAFILKKDELLVVGLTACAAPLSNNNVLKPISYKILRQKTN